MRVTILLFVLVNLNYLVGYATHLRAADILVEQECNSLRFKITVRVYLNTLSSTPFGGSNASDGHINFGDGTPLQIIFPANVQGPTPRPDLGPEIAIATFTTFHTYTKEGIYKITYFERDRSGGILNIPNSHDVAYTTFVTINARSNHCNNVPVLQVAPVDRGCRGVVFYHSAGATDVDGDSLSYELTVPSQDSLSFAEGFRFPDDPAFYADFEHGNEAKNGRPKFQIDPVTGLVTWDAPGMQGEYNIAFKIVEWRFDPASNGFFVISTSIRDMQIVIEDCQNKRPLLSGPPDVCIQAGETVTAKFVGTDPDNHPVKIEVFSPIFSLSAENSPATVEPALAEFRPSSPPAEVDVEWKTNCSHVRDQAYQVVVKITDSPPSGPKLVTFTTWNIRVIAPPPNWISLTPDLSARTAVLQWEEYACSNATKIQVWRRVGSSPFSPDKCASGLSVHKGYQLIAELPASSTSYHDTNNGRRLAVGATYCYRLVAVFPSPAGGKSYVSSEDCIGPILADAPIITNVSVTETRSVNGRTEVRWMKPLDISAEQYPEPYQYEVYRSDGFSEESMPVLISPRLEGETTFIDTLANTLEGVYNYRVVLYSRTQNNQSFLPIDTSAIASTVRLELEPAERSIRLTWNAEVPWSNVVPERPWHRIYRGTVGQERSEFALIDSVEVSEFGFEFIDEGKFQNQTLQPDIFYSYFVETVGFYGNDHIPLLFNLSQEASSYPVNNLPLCTPVLAVKGPDCASSTLCGAEQFQNEVTWSIPPEPGCRRDAVSFNIYVAADPAGEFTLLHENFSQLSITETVPTPTMCYKVTAVDANGIESEFSETSCGESCPFFYLPNVFTPNGDGCNDTFSAYADEVVAGSPCVPSDASLCPRFVESVNLTVLNRWGRIVYEFQSGEGAPITIDWDGRQKNGSRLEPGLYYYVADVRFDAMDPTLKRRKLKGWVHLLY